MTYSKDDDDSVIVETNIATKKSDKHRKQTMAKLKNFLDTQRSNKVHIEEIMKLSTLKDAHIYCKCNNLSGQFAGPILEKYIKIKYNFTKNNASSRNGDLNREQYNIEVKTSNGGKKNDKFNFVQIRINHHCEYILTAFYISYTNLEKLGNLYIFRLNKENMKFILANHGQYAHGTTREFGKITIEDLEDECNSKEYAIRPKYGDKCWLELLDYRIEESDI
jgi:hypothetical protein